MKKIVGFLAMLMIGLNFISCSLENITEEDELQTMATDGEKEHVNEQPDD